MTTASTIRPLCLSLLCLALSACTGAGDSAAGAGVDVPDDAAPSALDQRVRALIDTHALSGDPNAGRSLPAIDDPLAQLGMRLFFSRSLGGVLDTACASCHHPTLGGGDALPLPVGVGAENPALLGPGRQRADRVPNVPRNAPTTFNLAIWDRFLFHDGRIEALDPVPGAEGRIGAIRTPDTAPGVGDPDAGPNLATAQARFPVTSADEMRHDFLPAADNAALRERLAARVGDYGDGTGDLDPNDWLPAFQAGIGIVDTAENLVHFGNIITAIATYERSQAFVDTPWNRYVAGELTAIDAAAKRGAELFYGDPPQGAGCARCHAGDRFTDEQFHTVAFPLIGPGKGDGPGGSDDFGRERETGNANDRYAFRTPTLLNVELTAPYGRSGAYATLREVIRHYDNPAGRVRDFFDDGGWCQLAQFAALAPGDCASLYPDAEDHSESALAKLAADRNAGRSRLPQINLNNGEVADLEAFLLSLTDDCAVDPACRAAWVPPRDGGPDGRQLDAVDAGGDPL